MPQKRRILEAQFGLILNWALVAQSGRWPLIIIVMDILVKKVRNILSDGRIEIEKPFFLDPATPSVR